MSTYPPSPRVLARACSSVGVLLDGNVSHGPGLATICGDQIARGTVEREGARVVWIRCVHDDCRVEVVVLWDGSTVCLLALHCCCKRWLAVGL